MNRILAFFANAPIAFALGYVIIHAMYGPFELKGDFLEAVLKISIAFFVQLSYVLVAVGSRRA